MQPPFHVVSLSPARVSALVWHTAGEQRVTLVVKASFALVHDGPMSLVKAEPVVVEDVLVPSSGSLAQASEVAPFLPGADVILRGHACAPAGQSVRAMSVRLAVFRDRWLVDKTLHVYGDRASKDAAPAPFQRLPVVYERACGGPGIEDNPAGVGGAPSDPRAPNVIDPKSPSRPAGFGPVARGWSPRVRLAPREPAIEGSVLRLPDGFPFRYFHVAPGDQQIDQLVGDEWIVVEGMHPEIPRLSARLPSARGAAMRYRTDGKRAAPMPVEMVADTLSIDMDAMVATLLFRGHFTLEAGETPASFRAFAGVELPGVPVDWPDLDDLIAPAHVESPSSLGPPSASARVGAAAPVGAGAEVSSPVSVTIDADEVEEVEELEVEELNSTVPLKAMKIAIVDTLPFGATSGNPSLATSGNPSLATSGNPSRPKAPAPDLMDTTRRISLEEVRARANRPIAPFALAEPGSASPRFEAIPGAPWSPTGPRSAAELPEPEHPAPVPSLDIESPETVDVPAAALSAYLGTPFGPSRAAAPPVAPPPAAVPPGEVTAAEENDLNTTAPEMALPGLAPPPLWAGVPSAQGAPAQEAPPTPDMIGPLAVAEVVEKPAPAPAEAAPRLPQPVLPVLAIPAVGKAAAPAKVAPKPPLAVPALPVLPVKPTSASPAPAAAGAPAPAGAPAQNGAPAEAAGAQGAANAPGAPAGGGGAPAPAKNTSSLADVTNGPDVRSMLAARLATGESVRGIDLAGADLRTLDLSGADLSGAILRGANLGEVKLCEARLEGADLADVDLRGADLSGADLRRAVLTRADLRGAKAGGANFTEASLERASCAGVDLSGACLSRASLQHVTAEGANLSRAQLPGADLRQARLIDATLDGADLREISAARADFTRASLAGAKLGNAQLRSARLRGAILTGASLEGADLRDADLERTDLRGSTRGGAKLSGASLRDAVE